MSNSVRKADRMHNFVAPVRTALSVWASRLKELPECPTQRCKRPQIFIRTRATRQQGQERVSERALFKSETPSSQVLVVTVRAPPPRRPYSSACVRLADDPSALVRKSSTLPVSVDTLLGLHKSSQAKRRAWA